RRGVGLVVGHLNSGASIPASAVYAKHGILQITPYSPNPALTEDAFRKGWRTIFRTYTRDDAHAITVARYLADVFKAERIAILHDGTAFGQSVGREALKNLRLAGLQHTLFLAYAPQQRDYSDLVSHLRSRGISVIYITGWYGSDVALMIRQAHEMGYRPRVISTDAITTPRFWDITGRAGEGTLLTFVPDQRKNPAARTIVQRFHRENFEPWGYTLYAYAAVQAWAQAAESARSLKTDALVRALRTASFDTVVGKLRFDEKGDVAPQVVAWYVWHNGRYVPATDKDLLPHPTRFPEQQSSRVPPLCRDVGGYEAYMRRTGEACRLY
nr:branched-chain amino acid ABC transporter substrate-binding protein [Alphaproteobacteria bacterium]